MKIFNRPPPPMLGQQLLTCTRVQCAVVCSVGVSLLVSGSVIITPTPTRLQQAATIPGHIHQTPLQSK